MLIKWLLAMIKRLFDFFGSLLVLLLLFPFFLWIAIIILLTSKGGIFYKQERIGKDGVSFMLIKFRTMKIGADKQGLITVGEHDNRITPIGYYLRKYKLDEFPQLINILKGEMSVVGPRPEVSKYVRMYSPEQQKVLSVKPGLTDLASLQFINENKLLGQAKNPDEVYIREIMPEKLRLNLLYVENQGFFYDIKIILKTLKKIVIND
jgi:lipopolysaccharide/colanic/teichoic acid biosynthesis glycosyltransferase